MIDVICLALEDIKAPNYVLAFVTLLLIFVIGDRFIEYTYKYKLVALRQNERLEIIKYYREHPEVEEVWMPRFPVYTIHGGDIEEGDTYHFETFKEFYNLPQSADKIIFYFMEDEQ